MAAPLKFPLRCPQPTSPRVHSLLDRKFPMQPLALHATDEQINVFVGTLERRIETLRGCGSEEDLGMALLFQQQLYHHLAGQVPVSALAPVPAQAAGDAHVPGLPADAPAWVAALLNRFDRLELSLVKRMDKLWNGTAQKPEHTLVPISNNVDVLPANADPPVYFPPTFGALAVLSAQQTIALLDFYQLDVPVGDDGIVIDEQIMCIADHIGARFML